MGNHSDEGERLPEEVAELQEEMDNLLRGLAMALGQPGADLCVRGPGERRGVPVSVVAAAVGFGETAVSECAEGIPGSTERGCCYNLELWTQETGAQVIPCVTVSILPFLILGLDPDRPNMPDKKAKLRALRILAQRVDDTLERNVGGE
ncbi:MAG TPA: hypothetical protein VD902_19265 [Symbiobacteriaceae bacterium]|nr:hypothetical protein [Symbiobacteriaceae bacterium]